MNFALPALMLLLLQAGQSATPTPPVTFRSSTNLVLVDVIAMNHGLPDNTLERGDFEILDNGRPVAIKTFDSGAQLTTRPLALWFVVQCDMQGWERQGSGLFRGQIHLFQPALKGVGNQDTVAVAHWCDNGDAQIDLRPTANLEELSTTLEQVLAPTYNPGDHDRPGELSLQKTLQLIVEATRSMTPEPLPVVIFLYGDYSAMPRHEADHFIDELLETSAVAFGLRDLRSPGFRGFGEQGQIANYIATQTGGQYLRVTPDTYASGLEEILRQLHFRYELGFKPETLDGKRHKLTVRLTAAAQRGHKTTRLRSRAAYVPISPGK